MNVQRLHTSSLVAAAAAALLALPLAGPTASAEEEISIYFIGCAAPTGFHGYLARGAEEAGDNLGVDVTYVFPDKLTIPLQVQKIEEAIAAQADGIAVCAFAKDEAYEEVAGLARDAGIAFGSAAAPPAGSQVRDPNDIFLFRTGSDERAAGALTAQRLIAMGVKGRVVVGDQQPGDADVPRPRRRPDRGVEGGRDRGRVPRADPGSGPAVGSDLQLPQALSGDRGGDLGVRRHRRFPLRQGGERPRRSHPSPATTSSRSLSRPFATGARRSPSTSSSSGAATCRCCC